MPTASTCQFLFCKTESRGTTSQVACALKAAVDQVLNFAWTQRDGMGREEGGGFRMGNTCIPVADSF